MEDKGAVKFDVNYDVQIFFLRFDNEFQIALEPLYRAQPVWRNGRAYDSGLTSLAFETRMGQLVFL